MRLAAAVASLSLILAMPALAADPAPAPKPATAAPSGPLAAFAATKQEDVAKLIDPSTVPALRNIIEPGVQIRYMGDEYGLKSYFVYGSTSGQVVYTTPDGQATLIGGMFSGDGTPVSVLQLARLKMSGFDAEPYLKGNATSANTAATTATPAPAPAVTQPAPNPSSPGEQLLAETNNLSWIAFGPPTGAPITIFMDPNCDHCHALFKTLLPYTQAGKVYLRVIPVSVVEPEKSREDVLNVMSSSSPSTVWAAKVNGTAVPAVATPNPQAEAALGLNNNSFNRWQLGVTPYSIYRSKASGELRILTGQPTSLANFLAELGVTP